MLAIARADGWSVIAVAGASFVLSVYHGSYGLATAAGLVVLTGTGELHGRRLLVEKNLRGFRWLIGAQLLLLGIISLYAWYRWHHFDAVALWAQMPAFVQTLVTDRLVEAGLDPTIDLWIVLDLANQLTCLVLGFVTLLYQGGLSLWYGKQRSLLRHTLLASS